MTDQGSQMLTQIINPAAAMTGTNWMTGIILLGRSLGIDEHTMASG